MLIWSIEYTNKNKTDIIKVSGFDNYIATWDCSDCDNCILFDNLIRHIVCNSLTITPRSTTPYINYDKNDLQLTHHLPHTNSGKFGCRVKNK